MPRKEEPKEILGLNRITKKRIKELCKKDKLYQTPELNDVLYLHYQGFECIECLEDYTELKCLWLECNALSVIQGLEKQTKLKCLFLQSNLITKIENLECCKELDTLNLSQNHIRKIENCGFEVLPVLNTLNLSSNYLKDCEGLRELELCQNLSVLDLSNNRIDDILVVKVFACMPELKVLILQGNPVVSKIPQYRKTLILECKKLTYLDSRPIFAKDRACAEAWKRGGYEEERKENERWKQRERKKMRDSVNATIQLRNKYRKLDDQISLIPSSDSEEDTNTIKKNASICANPKARLDSSWNEVAEEEHFERNLYANKSVDSNMIESKREHVSNNKLVDFMITGKENENSKIIQEQEKMSRMEDIKEEVFSGSKEKENVKILKEEDKVEEEILQLIDIDVKETVDVKKNEKENTDFLTDQKKILELTEESLKNLKENIENVKAQEIAVKDKYLKFEKPLSSNLETGTKQDEDTNSRITISQSQNPRKVQLYIETVEKLEKGREETLEFIQDLQLTDEEKIIGCKTGTSGTNKNSDEKIEANLLKTQSQNPSKVQDRIENVECLENNIFYTDKNTDKNKRDLHLTEEESRPKMSVKSSAIEEKFRSDLGTTALKSNSVEEINRSQNCSEEETSVHTDSDINYKESYDSIIKAIEKITKSEGTSEVFPNAYNENLNKGEESLEDNYEPLKEIDETMNFLLKQDEDLQPETNFVKPLGKSKYDLETLKINNQVQNDFEELTKNLNVFVKQLGKEQEIRHEVIRALFNQEISNEESSSESSDKDEYEEKERKGKESELERVNNKITQSVSKEEEIRFNFSETETKKTFKEPMLKEGFHITIKKELETKRTEDSPNIANSKELVGFEYKPMDFSCLTHRSNEALDSLEIQSKELKKLLEKLENDNEELFRDIKGNINRQSENENNENQENLQIIEMDNEKATKNKYKGSQGNKEKGLKEDQRKNNWKRNEQRNLAIPTTNNKGEPKEAPNDNFKPNARIEKESKTVDEKYRAQIVENIVEEILINLNEQSDNISQKADEKYPAQIVDNIVEEILVNLNKQSDSLPENYEDYLNFPKIPAESHNDTKTIPEFLESFKTFFKNIKTNDQEAHNNFSANLYPEQQKSDALKKLSEQTNLKQFNSDTLELLDAQLEEIKRGQHAKVRRMVDRVYAQKERYNDTLELVEGKLMIRNKETEELTELPQVSQQDSSDSEINYDTANSEEEKTNFKANLRKKSRTRPFRSVARKSSGDLIIQALTENFRNQSVDYTDKSEESSEEFYSLDAADSRSLYNIDREFFNTFTFDNLDLSEMDENHIVQCAKSYEELKHCMTLSKEERCLTEQENELVENMIERKCVKLEDNWENEMTNLSNVKDLKKEEQDLLNRMSLKVPELKKEEKAQVQFNESLKFSKELQNQESCKDSLKLNLISNNESIKLFEYKVDTIYSEHLGEELTDSQQESPKEQYENYLRPKKGPIEDERMAASVLGKLLTKNISGDTGNEQPTDNEGISKLEIKSEVLKKESVLEDILAEKERDKNPFLNIDQQSEEEKNEIENNIDFEGATANIKILDFKANVEKSKEKSIKQREEVILNESSNECYNRISSNLDDDCTDKTAVDFEVLECNLQILADNNEVLDNITVNAELHF